MNIKIIGYTTNPELNYLPEAISAGFARVSRKPEPISELVEEAKHDLEKARKSNETIIYGYGHNSIAEHIVFNLVFEKISRRMSMLIMSHRLNSYIEKSQRYITIDSGFTTPKEIEESRFSVEYDKTCNELFQAYDRIFRKLISYVRKQHPEWKEVLIENTAKEDARFLLPISCFTQFGMTLNARNYENLIMRLKSQKLSEGHEAANILLEEGRKIAPSVIKYTDKNLYFAETYDDIKTELEETTATEDVKLIDYDKGSDNGIIIALLYSITNAGLEEVKKKVFAMTKQEKEEFMKKTLAKLSSHDAVLREFEYPDFLFELEISECCYHQFVRHRMNTQTIQPYTAELGFVIPLNIKKANLEDEFKEAVESSTKMFNEMKKELPNEAPYVLTNAHKRRVLVKMNARTLYHFSRIREEEYSQWEIRELAQKMLALAKEKAPLTFMASGGRSHYKKSLEKEEEKKEEVPVEEKKEFNDVFSALEIENKDT